jgi:uncharacterized membrane protein
MAKKTRTAATKAAARHRLKIVRILRGHLKLFAAIRAGLLLLPLLPGGWQMATQLLVAWDFASFVYLATALMVIRQFDLQRVQVRAEETDEGGAVILLLTVATALASLAAIVIELGSAHAMKSDGAQQTAFILAAITVILSWTLIHTIFAFHYAHIYYRGPGTHGRGLDFPGDTEPDYWDFVYFSFVIGMTFQVSDVQITRKQIRRLVVAHGVVSFLFNVAILALTVNIGANLI